MHPSRPDTLFMQKHWDVMRSDDGGDTWHEVSGNLPTDFGFPIAVHAHEPETVYVVPITSDSHHFPPDGKLRVYRSRTGGDEWEALTDGLPQENCYVNVLRDAMAVDTLARVRRLLRHDRRSGLRLGRLRGQLERRSCATCRPCCRWRCRRCRERAPGRSAVVLPAHLRQLARCEREVAVEAEPDPARRARRDRGALPGAARNDARSGDRRAARVRPVLRAARRTSPTSRRTRHCPTRSSTGREPFLVIGAMAGG